jgi:hypothetical protein
MAACVKLLTRSTTSPPSLPSMGRDPDVQFKSSCGRCQRPRGPWIRLERPAVAHSFLTTWAIKEAIVMLRRSFPRAPRRRNLMRDLGLLILRVVIGGFLAGHGSQKLFGAFEGPGLRATRQMMAGLGLRPDDKWAGGRRQRVRWRHPDRARLPSSPGSDHRRGSDGHRDQDGPLGQADLGHQGRRRAPSHQPGRDRTDGPMQSSWRPTIPPRRSRSTARAAPSGQPGCRGQSPTRSGSAVQRVDRCR